MVSGERQMHASNRSVLRALSILKAFHGEGEFVSVSEISRRADLPFASTYRLLQALEKTGAVEKGDGAFRLGFLIASLARNVNVDRCLYDMAQAGMADLSQKLGVTVSLGRLEGGLITILGRVISPLGKQRFATIGSRLAAYGLALGRVMLADLDERSLDEFMSRISFEPFTLHTVTNKSKLIAELATVRKLGFAVVREEFYPGMGCVAVPLHDDEQRVIAALSASESIEELTPERLALLREELLKLASAIRVKVLPDFAMADSKAAGD